MEFRRDLITVDERRFPWQVAKGVPIWVAGIALVLGACAPTVQEGRSAPSLTPAEAARLQDLQAAAERVRVVYGAGCLAKPCTPGFLIREDLEAVAIWDGPAFRIWLVRRALAAGAEPRPAVAHELGHWLLGHTVSECAVRAFECETAANAEGVRILVAGWGVSESDAISLMYNSLLAGLRGGRRLRGHEDPCREATVFAQTFNRPPPPCPVHEGPATPRR
jgi:hypothetical protein